MNILSKVTLKNLKKNKTRTVVTIIGIILSVSMFTAVTTLISSMQNYLVETVKQTEGAYQASAENVKPKVLEKMDNSDDFEGYASLRNFGYAKVNSKNEYKPYLFVGGINKDFTKYLNINMIKGKMPQKTNEIILPEHLKTNGKVEYKIGSIITLDIGERKLDDIKLSQNEMYDEEEKLINTSKKTFTVVGFYERPTFEDYSAPGYTALTVDDKNSNNSYDVYYAASNVRKIYDISKTYFKNNNVQYHDDLLRFYGVSNIDGFNKVLYGFAIILIVIIMLGSISLIYNAFSISVSERTKQFGLLKSIGATKKQILRSVIFEALFLCLIGIPLGLLAGIGGIGITLWAVNGLFMKSFYLDSGVDLILHPSLLSILIAATIGLITVLISAYIPAKRAAKKTAIEAIRQSGDIKIKAKKVKTTKLTYKLFGFSGMIANKNFKRNRKKYRATVISLTMSIILFISASTFSTYMSASYNEFAERQDYDISYGLSYEDENNTTKSINKSTKIRNLLGNQPKVLKSVSVFDTNVFGIFANKNDLQDKINIDDEYYGTKNGKFLSYSILFISDDIYKDYLVKNHFDVQEYTDKNNMKALVNSSFINKSYDAKTGDKTIKKLNVFDKNKVNLNILMLKKIKNYKYIGYNDADKAEDLTVSYVNNEKELNIPIKDATEKKQIEATCFEGDGPYGTKSYSYSDIVLIMPESFMDSFTSKYCFNNITNSLYFSAKDHRTATENMTKALKNAGYSSDYLYDARESQEANMALLIVVDVFTYGFIILISLISIANVFNTISTNITLRKREFAMLKSIGMTKKAFNKMMNYECLLYGIKSIIYGLPIGLFISYLLGRIMREGLSMGYIFPTKAMIIAVVSIFIVVFVTMTYSMNKIKKDSPIETLKNENI